LIVDSATLNQNAPNSDAKPLRSKVKLNAVSMVAALPAPERLRAKRGLQLSSDAHLFHLFDDGQSSSASLQTVGLITEAI